MTKSVKDYKRLQRQNVAAERSGITAQHNMESRVQTAEIFDHEMDVDFVALHRFSRFCRKVEKMTIRLPRSRQGPTGSGQEQQSLQTAVQHMIQNTGSQTETLDVVGLRAAFAPLDEAVYRMQGGQAHTVKMDEKSLLVLAKRLVKPGETFVLLQVPCGLRMIGREIVQLHLNCCALSCIPDFVCGFENMEVFALDGNSRFLGVQGVSNPEYMDRDKNSPPTYTWPARLLKLPDTLGSMRSLKTLSLCDMPEIRSLPASFAHLTGLTALVVENCPKLVLTEDMGRMPSLTHLTLREDNCLNLPACVGSWPLTHLTIEHDLDPEGPHPLGLWQNFFIDYLPPQFLGRLSSSLESLHLDTCLPSHLDDLPLMPRLTSLTVRPGETNGEPNEDLVVCVEKMPALQHVDGISQLPDNLPAFTSLQYLRLFRCAELPETIVAGSKSLLHLVIDGKDDYNEIARLPAWFTGDTFPNLQTLQFDAFVNFPWVPPCIASFRNLTELVFSSMGCFDTAIATVIDPSVFQMKSLRVLKMTDCDFKILPPMFLPSLEYLYITDCVELYELPEFAPNALPKLALMHLNGLYSIKALPESMGELTALTRLNILAPLSTLPMSMRSLTALRELTLNAQEEYGRRELSPNALFTDISCCLPALCNLRKLSLIGRYERSLAQRENDTLAIGLALRAWPMPLLDLMDTQVPHVRSPFNFKLQWRMLGLPAEGAGWDDVQILEHWRAQKPKTLAFASATHHRLGQDSPFAHFPNMAMLMVTDELSGWQDLRATDSNRGPQRIVEQRRECARRAEYMIDEEDEVRKFQEVLRVERLQMGPPPEPERSYELEVDRAREQQRLKILARIGELEILAHISELEADA